LAQIKTLNCGSKRLTNFREFSFFSIYSVDWAIQFYAEHLSALQLTYPGSKIPTLREVFEFAECADPELQISWNIESKINPIFPNKTRGVADFVSAQHKEFVDSSYNLSQITVRSYRHLNARYLTLIDSIRALTGGR
jgi:hypothetical protein